jgi:phospholipase C
MFLPCANLGAKLRQPGTKQPIYFASQLTITLADQPNLADKCSRFLAGFSWLWPAILLLLLGFNACGGSSSSQQPPPPQQVQLTVSVTGTGTVVSSPAGINCPSACTASFASGTSVTLTATAGSGFSFGGFGGACSGSTCSLVLSSNQTVSAAFTASGTTQLTVSVSGSGTVTSSPSGIDCPTTCSASFNDGTTVALSATPAAGNNFSGFSGACTGMSCQLTLSGGQNQSVTVTFVQPPQDITAINHIIILLQENRSFDHYFGHLADYWQVHGFPQATNGTTFDGEPTSASNVDLNGDTVSAFNLQSTCTENPSPSWNESHTDRNRFNQTDSNVALMDGFVHTAGKDASGYGFYGVLGHHAMGYFVGDNQLNYYYFMASSFATSDRWFAPLMSRTQPNRMYLYGATSAGHVNALNATGSPPLTNQTIFELMQGDSISWKIYVHPDASGCTTPSCLYSHSYLGQFTYGKYVINNLPNQFASTAQLLSDMQNGTLPQVSFIEPAGYVGLDEHSPTVDVLNADSVQAGAAYVASLVNALMTSPSWKDSVFILTHDEPGGFYDHVAPQPAVPPDSIQYPTDILSTDICANNTSPVCGFFVTGFRVPLIVISPFTKPNYVSHTVMDYTAMLKLIETRFNLPSLTARDAAQPDMTEFFDFVNVPLAIPPTPPAQLKNMPCVLEALDAVTISPNPAAAGGQATVTLSLSKNAIQNVTVTLSSSSSGVVPPSAQIANGTSSATLNITVPTGITSLTITGSIAGIPVSGTVPVQ